MRDPNDESWKLLNDELRAARDAATSHAGYPARTRFDQAAYDRLSAEAWARYRERTEQRLRHSRRHARTSEI